MLLLSLQEHSQASLTKMATYFLIKRGEGIKSGMSCAVPRGHTEGRTGWTELDMNQ